MRAPEVEKLACLVPTSVLGTDEQGRMLVACPTCHEPAPVLADGTIACPLGEAIGDFLAQQLGGP